MFVIRDMRTMQRLEELGFLARLASEIAAQIQTPLTLASSWVQRMADESAAMGGADPANPSDSLPVRTVAQLRRIQGVVDRIAFYDSRGEFVPRQKIPLSLHDEVAERIANLPTCDQERLAFAGGRDAVTTVIVGAHRAHLSFVLDTLFACLLRDLPGDHKIAVQVDRDSQAGWIQCQVPKRAAIDGSSPDGGIVVAGPNDVVEQGVRRILDGGGNLSTRCSGGQLYSARVELPLFHMRSEP